MLHLITQNVLPLMRPLRCCTVEEGFQTSDASCVGDGFQLGIRNAELWRLVFEDTGWQDESV